MIYDFNMDIVVDVPPPSFEVLMCVYAVSTMLVLSPRVPSLIGYCKTRVITLPMRPTFTSKQHSALKILLLLANIWPRFYNKQKYIGAFSTVPR